MKTLYLVRHAKSSWNFPQLEDFERPLGKRGRNNLSQMGIHLKENVPKPDLIITSSASRAFYTALFLADYWNYPEQSIFATDSLYHAGVQEFQNCLAEWEQYNRIAIFGHNPGLTMFHNKLSSPIIDNIPTCGIVGLSFQMSRWKQISQHLGQRLFYYTPKSI